MFARRFIHIFPAASKLMQQSCTCNPLLKLFQQNRGYAAPVLNKLAAHHRFMSTSTKESNVANTEQVYYGVLTQQIKAVKIVSFTTSIGGLLAQPILIKQISSMDGGLPVIIGLCSFIGFFTFITPLLLHFVCKKYVTCLEYDVTNNKYIATVLSFFCRPQKIQFSVDDVKVPDVPGMFTSFHVNGRPLFVDPGLFTDPTHYGKLMGYDKPMDFKLSESSGVKRNN